MAALMLPGALARASGQDPDHRPRRQWMLGASAGTPLLVDGNGTRVRGGVAPTAGVRLAMSSPGAADRGVELGLVVRGARGPLLLHDGAERWSGGSYWQLDALAGVGRCWRSLEVTGAAGVVMVGSTRPVSPLASMQSRPAAEVVIGFWPGYSGWGASVGIQGYRMPAPGGRAGGVARLIVGIGRGF